MTNSKKIIAEQEAEYSDCMNHVCSIARDTYNKVAKGKKRTINLPKGTVVHCVGIKGYDYNGIGSARATVVFEGNLKKVNAKWLKPEKALTNSQQSKGQALIAESNKAHEEGRNRLLLLADLVKSDERKSWLDIGNNIITVPNSQFDEIKTKDGTGMVSIAQWVMVRKFSDEQVSDLISNQDVLGKMVSKA